ncbi:putative cardiolipin synthetase [Wickerhamomyces ciferrii]|uniref:Cardiolipin synthetase n=1 Tax=Wickerhamomyces ciferrii (strain ATCC 14091 / BCRC 22168 / CBS 111 / JCM 3599 / NBRC 0793 / NRRL Y-1031 F-60-10) TaxID=1206466 RepID=K0KT86_WICCF|nr:putative cardiolipin synthetase [Wickerhamomyces ciferrii]CCH44584.1 putative cardiolipin synthetase [Wickerhamomyces ciferrii]
MFKIQLQCYRQGLRLVSSKGAQGSILSSVVKSRLPINLHQQSISIRSFSQFQPLLQQQQQNNQPKPKLSKELGTKFKQNVEKSKEIKEKLTKPIKDLIPEHENIYTIPNILTFTRLISAPIIGWLIVKQQIIYALGLFAYSCITDFIDGFIARKFKMHSVVGSIIDPMADKFLMVICTACLAQASQIPLYLAVVILGRDALLAISAFYYRYISLPAPKTIIRYFDFSIPSAEVHPTTISKYNTGFQMLYIGAAVVKPVLLTVIEPTSIDLLEQCFTGFGYFVCSTTILSGLSYVFSNNAVKILNQTKK